MTDVRELMARLYAAADNAEMLSPSVVRALLADSAAALAGMVWQPIATAPRDGTAIFCYGCFTGFDLFFVGYFDIFSEHWRPIPGDDILHPTHWMPLPEPPDAEGK